MEKTPIPSSPETPTTSSDESVSEFLSFVDRVFEGLAPDTGWAQAWQGEEPLADWERDLQDQDTEEQVFKEEWVAAARRPVIEWEEPTETELIVHNFTDSLAELLLKVLR